MKTCSKCHETKNLELFSKSSNTRDGKYPWCKPCVKAYHAARYIPKPVEPFVMPTEKACSKCGTVKPLGEFHRQSRARDGHYSSCKACASSTAKSRYVPRARKLATDKLCNRCKVRKDKTEFYGKKTLENICKPCSKEKNAGRKRSSKNPAVNAAKNTKRRGVPFRPGVPEFMHTYFKKCMACGATDRKLHIDHVMPVALGGTSALKNLQMLCPDCNLSKGATFIDYRYPGLVIQ